MAKENSSPFTLFSDESFERALASFVSFITKKPGATILVATLFTLLLIQPAWTFKETMTSDVEVYLPEGEETTDLLLEVREEWSTDVILIYVETPNALSTQDTTNITDRHVLLEMSRIEGDAYHEKEYYDSQFHGALDWNKDDRGNEDGIVFVLSISTIIKELNSSTPRFVEAMERQFEKELGLDLSYDDEAVQDQGEYAIPDDQERIDQYVDSMGSSLESMAIDTNGDDIWDTAAILIAIKHFEDAERREMIDTTRQAIEDRETQYTTMTATGLVVVLEDVSQAVYKDLTRMVALSFLLVVGVMYYFHRTFKILVISAVPVLFSIIWSFGLLRFFDLTMTPMVVAAGPILIGIGVDYSLHVTNRIVEFNKTEDFKTSVVKAYRTSGKATALCALTDAIGFSALLIPFIPGIGPIVSIKPMRTVGLTMILGVFFSMFFTMLLTPPLIILLKYKKQAELKVWKKVGEFPVKYKQGILAAAIVFTLLSLSVISVMDRDIRGDEAAPEGIDSLDKIKEYTRNFEAGQTNIVIVRGDPAEDDEFEPIKDIDLLDVVDVTQTDIAKVRNTSAMSVVNFFKAIKVNFTIALPNGNSLPLEGSLWDVMHSDALITLDILVPEAQSRRRFIEVSYETLSNETRSMLINDGYTKTLIYTEMPYINIKDTKDIVNNINQAIEWHRDEMPGDGTISSLTGGAPVTISINDAIKNSQWTTIFVSLILVSVVLIALFGLKKGIMTLVPIIMVVLLQPLTMQGAGTNVNIFTAMMGTIIIGIGIDCAVHITERVEEEGWDDEGIAKATEHTGQTLVEATGTTMAGVFAGVLIALTSFAGLMHFFLIITLLIFYSLLAGLFVLPAQYAAVHSLQKRRKDQATRRIFGEEEL